MPSQCLGFNKIALPTDITYRFYIFDARLTGVTIAQPGVPLDAEERACNDWASHARFNFNFSLAANTTAYPMGSQYDTTLEPSVGEPSAWPNPRDVEFVFSSCRGFNCWVEPRCAVEAVGRGRVSLRQSTGGPYGW